MAITESRFFDRAGDQPRIFPRMPCSAEGLRVTVVIDADQIGPSGVLQHYRPRARIFMAMAAWMALQELWKSIA